jgi:type II secretory pathway predicted ATPase ExeA
VQSSLRSVGASKPVFSAAALTHLHQLSGGMPRRVGQLAQLALFAAAGQELQEVDLDTVHAVFEELDVSAALSF